MKIQLYMQTLRLHLLDMARACQRGVDYSIKGYQLADSECCFKVQFDTYEIDILHREILYFSRELMLMEISEEPTLRFALSVDRISSALRAVHGCAVEIATSSMRLCESYRKIECQELVSMGAVVNGLVRLCVVALFEEEVVHAQTVLHRSGADSQFATKFFDWYRTLDQQERTQAGYELSIAKHLSRIAREMQEVADAVVFWLNGPEHERRPDTPEPRMFRAEEPEAEFLDARATEWT